jgi:hypothetical protein
MNERDLREEPASHRTGETDAAGKKSVRKEILVTEQMAADILAVATIKRMSEGEYMRRCIERDLYGELELMRRSVRSSGQ